jgi:signal transduction histidine kinase
MTEITTAHQPTIHYLETHRELLLAALQDAFIQHFIDNRGTLTSPRRAPDVGSQIYHLALAYAQQASEPEVTAYARRMAEEGMAMETGKALMQALLPTPEMEIRDNLIPLYQLQLLFLERLGIGKEVVQQRIQERAQLALERALHTQLEQQIASHELQKKQNETLNQVLQLSTRLSRANTEEELLPAAVSGLSRALPVFDMVLFSWDAHTQTWAFRQANRELSAVERSQAFDQIAQAQQAPDGELFRYFRTDEGEDCVQMAVLLQTGGRTFGGMFVRTPLAGMNGEVYLIILRTFAQNLAAVWRNLHLLVETEQRARELEILYGRYLDSLWENEEISLTAKLHHHQLSIRRTDQIITPPGDFSLQIADTTFGKLQLPDNRTLSREEEEFVNVLLHEMSSALNNAQLVQTARTYSNQLSLAVDVSRAASTILERNRLIAEVVRLIRDRFNFFYVGLYLVDWAQNTAVLQAGSGEIATIEARQQIPLTKNNLIVTAIQRGLPGTSHRTQASDEPYPTLPKVQAQAALPLKARGQIMGAILIHSSSATTFTTSGIEVLQNLADQVGVAIDNATLFEQVQANLAKSTRLYQFSRRISEAMTRREVFQILVDFASQSDLVDLAQVFAIDTTSPGHIISPAFWSNLGIEHNPATRFSRDKFTFSEEMIQGNLIETRNGQADKRFDDYTRALFKNNGVRAALLVPIHTEDTWFGTLALDRISEQPLTPQEAQPFITLSDQAAIALSNLQLLKQTETLYQIGRMLNEAITRDDALEIATREVAKYTGANHCRFVLYDIQLDEGVVAAESSKRYVGQTLPLTDDFVYHYFQNNTVPLLLEAADNNVPPMVYAQHVARFGANVSLLIPAANNQQLIGFLAIDSQQGKRPFTSNNIIFAQTVVDHLTTQIENLKLLDEALQRAQELITLNQIQSNISHVLETKQLAHVVYEQIGRLLDNTIFTFSLYNPDQHQISPLLYIAHNREITLPPYHLHTTDPLYPLTQITTEVSTITHNTLPFDAAAHQVSLPQSSLWVPLIQEGKINGLISIHSYEPHAYDQNDFQLLRSIGTQANLALDNARLFERIQSHNEELMQLDNLKTQFLTNMSHELRTPLNSIIGFSRIILKGIDGPITTQQEEDLTSIYQNGQHLLGLINEILDMAKIEAGKMALAFEEVALEKILDSVYNTARGLLESKPVTLTWHVEPDLPVIEADGIRIRQILLNLLSNAIKYTLQGTIQFTARCIENHIHFMVQDSGIGIDPKDYNKIFVAFEQAESTALHAVGGTGLGLPITKWLVTMHQGTIYFESNLHVGTTFHVLLPISQNPSETAVPPPPLPI